MNKWHMILFYFGVGLMMAFLIGGLLRTLLPENTTFGTAICKQEIHHSGQIIWTEYRLYDENHNYLTISYDVYSALVLPDCKLEEN